MSMAAKGFALRRLVEGVRARAISTSLTVHILHLEESVNLCVSGGPWELDMRILDIMLHASEGIGHVMGD